MILLICLSLCAVTVGVIGFYCCRQDKDEQSEASERVLRWIENRQIDPPEKYGDNASDYLSDINGAIHDVLAAREARKK